MADQHEPSGQGDADDEDAAAVAARLERALDRIAAAAHPGSAARPGDDADESALAHEVAGRLDLLIEQVRAALAGP